MADQEIKKGLEHKLVGEQVPNKPLQRLVDDAKKATEVQSKDLFNGKLAVLIGVPGAFTPVCSTTHVPDYVSHFNELKKAGVEYIAVVSVNDPYVMEAWGKSFDAKGKLDLLADTDAAFSSALDVVFHDDKFKGPRSRRYSAVIQNGMIMAFNLEKEPSETSVSLSKVALGQIEALRKTGTVKAA